MNKNEKKNSEERKKGAQRALLLMVENELRMFVCETLCLLV